MGKTYPVIAIPRRPQKSGRLRGDTDDLLPKDHSARHVVFVAGNVRRGRVGGWHAREKGEGEPSGG
jgi:hypothetical protein